MRRLLAVILLLSFFCQAFATARQLVVFDHEGEFRAAHAEMHLEGSAHHHDEHGVAHQDDSPESIQHTLADAGPELLVRGIRVGKDRVRNLMKPHGIRARTKRKFVATTDSKHSLPVAPDLVQRRFNPEAPNQLWSSGIQLHRHRRGLAVPGCGHRPVQSPSGGLEPAAAHADQPGQGCAGHGVVAPPPRVRPDIPQLRVPAMVTGRSGTMNTHSRYPQSAAASGQEQPVVANESGRSSST